MTKRLISFFLTLVFLVAVPLSARYKYNPYTRKLDFYEAASDITLGDIGDITLTGLATGNVLYYDGAAWVNLATEANAEVLTLAAGIPSWAVPGAPAAHAASHEVGGADLVDHDQLTNYLAAQHLTLPNTLAAVLTDHNKAAHDALLIDADTVDGEHVAAIVTNARVKAHFPDTIANVLSDHNIGAHTPLGLLALPDTIASVLSDHNLAAHTALGLFDASADVDHNATTNYAANQHVVLPNTIANVLNDHNLAAHTALGLYDAPGDVDHDLTTNYVANQHIDHTAVSILSGGLITGGGTIDGNQTLTLTEATIEAAIDTLPNLTSFGTIATGVWQGTAIGAQWGGTGVDSSGWTDYVYVTAGVWAVDATLGKVVNGIAITGAAGSTVTITNDNTDGKIVSSTANLILESTGGAATIEITGDLLPSADITYDLGNNTLAWQDIVQTSTGAQYVGDTNVNGTWQTVRSGAMLSFQLREAGAYVEKASVGSTTAFSMNAALDHIVIAQTAAAGTEDQPLINIDDERTGATANEESEATIFIDVEGTYAFVVQDGYSVWNDRAYFVSSTYLNGAIFVADNQQMRWGGGEIMRFSWDTNGAEDGMFSWWTGNATGTRTNVIFISNLFPIADSGHNDYLSPTLIITNSQGADTNDYAGVVIGERTQADVKVAHYFDFYATTGAVDGSPDGANAELAATFRFGDSGSAVPDHATGPGDVLFEDDIEVDGVSYFGDATNYAQIAADGTLTLFGTARATTCYQIANAALGTGGTKPDAAIVGNYWGWSYDINDDSVFTVKLPDDYASGTDVTINIRWAINEDYVTNSGEVRWQATWSAHPADASEAIDDAGTTDDSGDINIPVTAYFLTQTTIETIPGASLSPGDEIGITVKRIALVGGSDPTADPVITCVGIGYNADKLGT